MERQDVARECERKREKAEEERAGRKCRDRWGERGVDGGIQEEEE